jgi:hypothetical protein
MQTALSATYLACLRGVYPLGEAYPGSPHAGGEAAGWNSFHEDCYTHCDSDHFTIST